MIIGQSKALGLAFTAVIALGAIAATAARAETEGPSWAVEGELQGAGETQEVTATAKSPFTFRNSLAKAKVECKAEKLEAGAVISGASSKSAGTGQQTIEFSQCDGGSKGESLSGCEPERGKVTTVPTIATLGYASSSRSGPILAVFAPETGTTLATLKFTGKECIDPSTTITGRLVGEGYTGGSPEEVGVNEVETVKQEVRFATTTKTIWTESAGALSSVKSSLSIFESASTLEGASTFELVSQLPFGRHPRRDVGELYSFTPQGVLVMENVGEVGWFTLTNQSGSELSPLLKLVGSSASEYELTDKPADCAIESFASLHQCEIGVKLLSAHAGGVLLEGAVEFTPGRLHTVKAKTIENG